MVEPIKLVYRPGIVREVTEYTATGGYVDGNLTRFVKGFPQSVGGWTRLTVDQALGTPRGLFPFVLLDGDRLYVMGTDQKYYLIQGAELIDITPLRETATLANPFTTTVGSNIVTVTDTAHGAAAGDFVTFSGATAVGGVTALMLNQEFAIASVINDNSYTIVVSGPASGAATGGGAAVVTEYQIHIGLNAVTLGLGFGTGPFGEGGFGEPSSSEVTGNLRVWSQDKFGEDIVACPRDQPIYYYDVSLGIDERMVALADMAGASFVPLMARQVMLSDADRHIIAFAVNGVTDSTQDRLLARWCHTEDIVNWEITTTTTAGSLRFDAGSEFITAVKVGAEIMVFTDVSLHSMKYVGAPYTFGQVKMADNVHIIGPGAAVVQGSDLYYMGVSSFHLYNGSVVDLDCDIQDFIFSILNFDERDKVQAGYNSVFGEIIWLMPVNGSEEVNFYVIYNPTDRTWVYGEWNDMGRTGWLDVMFEKVPLATAPDGYVYLHESGDTDGAHNPPIELDSWIEAAPMEIGNGDDFMVCSRIIPDVEFVGSSGSAPAVTITIEMVDAPGKGPRNTPRSSSTKSIMRTSTFPVQEHTAKKDLNVRGRAMKYRLASAGLGTKWRQGTHRLYAAPDGKR